MSEDDPRSDRKDRRYAALETSQVPLTESLKETVARFLPVSASPVHDPASSDLQSSLHIQSLQFNASGNIIPHRAAEAMAERA